MTPGPFDVVWLVRELLSSRLRDGEVPVETAPWIDLDEELREAGGSLLPGETAISPLIVGRLHRWRLAGVQPLLGTCTLHPDHPLEGARSAALEIDVLAGGAFDAIRILPAVGRGSIAVPSGPTRPSVAVPKIVNREREERVRGALLGLATGDCLGAPVENWPAEKIMRVHGPFRDFVSGRGWGPGHPTRETTLALLWTREIANGRTVHAAADRNRLAVALSGWVTARPRDFGHLTRGILRSYRRLPPVLAARSAWERANRTPEFNGALSRSAALGALLPDDRDLRLASAYAASALTHTAPVCLGAAIALAEGVAAAVRGDDPLDAARAFTWEARVSDALEDVAAGWDPGGSKWSGHDRGHVLNTLRVAFWAVRQHRGSEDLLLDIVHRGGDADTHAAAAGALLGARDGPVAIPERWISALKIRPVIESLIEKLRAC